MQIIRQKVATAGILMGTMLSALEGREDMLREKWIAELEDVEEGVGRWEMDGERVVLEGRLRLEEMIIRQSRKEEEAREREKTGSAGADKAVLICSGNPGVGKTYLR